MSAPDDGEAWVVYDLGQVFDLTKLQGQTYHDGDDWVHVSVDGVNWDQVYAIRSSWAAASCDLDTFYDNVESPKPARYIRFKVQQLILIGNSWRIAWFRWEAPTPYGGTMPDRSVLSRNGPKNGLGDPREDPLCTYPCAQGYVGDPINTRTGGFDYGWVDLNLPTVAGPLMLQRTYASPATTMITSTLSPGWTHNHDTRLILPTSPGGEAGTIWFKAHTANQYRFTTDYEPFPGVLATLTATGDPDAKYLLVAPDQSTYTFNITGTLKTWADPQGHVYSYTYDAQTRPITVTELASQRYLAFSYDGQGRLSTVADHAGRQVTYGYSLTSGDLLTVTDVLNQAWTYVYSGTTHLMTEARDPVGNLIVKTDYDAQGRAWRQSQGAQGEPIVQISYQSATTSVVTDARGYAESHVYGDRRELTNDNAPLGSVISKAYDLNFRPLAVRDPLSRTTQMTWSASGTNLSAVTDAANHTVQLSYNALNAMTRVVDARGQATSFEYDGTLRTVMTDTLQSTTRYTYTAAGTDPGIPVGLLKATSDPLGRTTTYQYDSFGQLARITDTAGLATAYGYDDLGRVITTTTLAGTAAEQITVNTFDAAGRLLQVIRNYTDASGAQNYAANGSVYNQITRYQYDPMGNTVALTDTLGLVTLTQYDANNRPVAMTVTTSAGQVQDLTRLLYDAAGNTISTTVHAHVPSLAQTTTTGYDALNRPVTTTTNYVDGAFDSDFPDEDIQTVTAYDAAGNVLTATEFHGTALARTSATSYDALNRPISITTNVSGSAGPDRNITSLTRYDAGGNVISTTAYAGVAGLEITTLTEYDALNRAVTTTTAAGTALALTSVTAYNAAGQVISTTEAFGTDQARTTLTEYDAAGRPVTAWANYDGTGVAAPDRNLVQVTVYDAFGRRAASAERRVDAAGTATWITTTFGYNNLGQLLTTTWPLTSGVFATASQAYDALGRVVTQTDELGRLTVTGYDALGRPVTVTANYVDGVFDPDFPDEDLVTVTTYDSAGNRVLVTDPKGIQTRFGYDLLGRLVQVVENNGQFESQAPVTTTYAYDGAGNLLTITDGRGKVSTFTYDLLGRQVTASDPLAHTTVYTYNAAGSQVALLDANGQETVYTYDLLGRMTGIDYPAGTADVSFEYDLLSQRTEMSDGTGTTTWGYDLAGRPVTITQAGIGAPMAYTYNSAGQRTALLYPGAQTASYQYDLAGRLVGVTDWTAQTTHYAYDTAGQLLTAALPNGVTTSYGYDSAYRLATITHQTALATLGAYTYTVDASGNRTGVLEAQLTPIVGAVPQPYATQHSVASGSVTATGGRGSVTGFAGGAAALAFTRSGLGTTTGIVGTGLEAQAISYTYDAMYRLTRADYDDGSYFHYEYDAVGNRLSEVACWGGSCTPITTTYEYDDANRLISVDSQAYTWDANGNLLADGTFTYTYDAANRLIAATNGLTVTEFTYNGLSDRVGQIVNGLPTTYTLDLAAGLTQVLADGSFTYLYGNGRIAQYDGANYEYFLPDALGSVRQLADESGDVTLAWRYEPYGDVLESVGTGETSYGYTGESFDEVTGLLYLRARFYSGSQGRFMARDSRPGGYIKLPYPGAGYEAPDTSRLIADDWPSDYTRPQSLNRWAYVEGDPINRIDPSGHWYCQSGLVPFGADCDTWVDNALATLRSSGPVGRRLEQFFHARDRALTIAGLAGMLICPPVSVYVTGVKIYFEPLVTRPLRSKAFTVNPDQIHINNTLAGYYGPNPSSEAVVTFGHEIAHLAQGIYEFSVQAEVLGTIVGYYLEDEVGASHRDDADYIIQNKLDPWNDLDLEEYNTQGILIPLPWPLRIGRGLSDNWLDQWSISLPYLNPPTSRESGLPGGGR
ncbi:MAG: hypothetical protein IT318_19560 [Anaerolineales bacterium]|nr:hypothetical protein [Anaerolineales bacterium]